MATKILMVCLGNICRSPLAEGILQSKLDPTQFQIASCGTSNYHIGKKPDQRSINIAKHYNIDISLQKAAQFTAQHFDRYNHIYAMDNENYTNIIKLARHQEDKNKVQLILNESHPQQNLDVPDPYYGGDQGFEEVYQLLDEACTHIVKKLVL